MGYIDETATTLGMISGNAYKIVNAVAYYIKMLDNVNSIKSKLSSWGRVNWAYTTIANQLGLREETVRSLENTSTDELKKRAIQLYGVTSNELDTAIGDVDQQIRWINNKHWMLYPKPNFEAIKNYYDNTIHRVLPIEYWRMIYQISQRTSLDSIIAQFAGTSTTDISSRLRAATDAINRGTDFNKMIADSLRSDANTVKSLATKQIDAINKEIFMEVSRLMINASNSTTWDSIAAAVHRSKEYIIGNHPFFKNRVTTIAHNRITYGSHPDIKNELLRLAKTDVTLKVSSAVWFQSNITDSTLRNKTILPNTTAGNRLAEEAAKTLYAFCNYLILKDKVIKAKNKGQSNLQIAESLHLIKAGETNATRRKNATAFVDLLKKYDY